MRVQLLTSCFLFLMFTFVSGQSEKDLLLELRNNLTYDSSFSTKLVHWNESSGFCQWPGVKCDSRNRVSALDLSGESISGGINDGNSSLFKLVYLQSLSLAENSFGSTELVPGFPSGFGRLTELRYLNLSNSGFSGQVPSDFSDLTRLVILDLSNTMYTALELVNPNLRRLIRNFIELRELYLDGVNISANRNEWGSALSSSVPNLSVLSLRNCYITGPSDSSLQKLKSLSVIRLDGNTFSSPLPDFFADFSNLSVFTLSGCNLTGVVPPKLFEIKSLQIIDLGNNRDLEGSLPEFPVNGSLQSLVLSYTKFSGNVSESIGNLGMLSNVDLTSCSFSGPVPKSIKNLSHLVYLDISLNQFSGSVPSFALLKNLTLINFRSNRLSGQILESHWNGLESLNFLDLSENLLQGEIPASVFGSPSLKFLSLSNNSFSGSIRVSVNTSSSLGLETLELSVNRLEGPVPRFLFELQNLSTLSLAWNKFNGSLDLTDFRELKNLVTFDLSYNNLSVHVSEKVPISSLFPQLGSLRLASCKLQQIPLLKNQSSLKMLDLSDNQLEGEIPNWIWEVGNGGFRHLNFSHNRFTHLQEPYDLRSLHYLDLHSNAFGGQIPIPPGAAYIDFSSNNFTSSLPPDIGNSLKSAIFISIADNKIIGNIPSSFCNTTSLQMLDLSNNSFNGGIPSCLLEKTLSVLNLRLNKLDGDIPDTFPVGCRLETLDLSRNALRGNIPKSLARCSALEVLNLGNNVLNDTFPCWLKNSSRLRVLEFRSNKLHGNIDCLGDSITWSNLQIISLVSNKFNGVIPANMFQGLLAFKGEGTQQQVVHLHFLGLGTGFYYQDSVTLTLKGQSVEMEKILTIFKSVDFSDNNFHGSVPQTIGDMKFLYLLNFSHNDLSGLIPSSIGNLQNLESLDLSFNDLEGVIPTQLASLTFLSFLNLSYNHLVGRIPHGSQIQTFDERSFIGNNGLCGFPLNKTCNDTRTLPASPERELEREEENSEIEIYVSVFLGFVVGLGFIFGPLFLCKRWRRWYHDRLKRILMLVLHQKDHHQLENDDW